MSASNTWYVVTIDTISGEISIMTEDGIAKNIDQQGTYTAQATTLADIAIKLGNGDLDVAVVNVEVVSMEFYDTDKTTLLKKELLTKGNINYVHQFATDSEGYTKTVDTWLPIDGSANKMYAAKAEYIRNQNVFGSDVALLTTNKYSRVDSDGIITFKIRIAATGWTGLNISIGAGNYVGVSGGLTSNGTDWLTVTINTESGEIVIKNAGGSTLELDVGNYTASPTTIKDIMINVTGTTHDVSVTR